MGDGHLRAEPTSEPHTQCYCNSAPSAGFPLPTRPCYIALDLSGANFVRTTLIDNQAHFQFAPCITFATILPPIHAPFLETCMVSIRRKGKFFNIASFLPKPWLAVPLESAPKNLGVWSLLRSCSCFSPTRPTAPRQMGIAVGRRLRLGERAHH
ncbi:hypothetical protein DFP72DRAFT_446829 [Ephemerocybe angulata]|uniref:Uncharacterized protein n=1 Tax=Ephemerocybe angulata TaxID=980116 RepID=A0A8H6M489_9AGAR|nr:hypothetical protein DFP72DRAFT_446829 [Tulosesus angulatus]